MTYKKSKYCISRGYSCSCPERLLCPRNREDKKQGTDLLKKNKEGLSMS